MELEAMGAMIIRGNSLTFQLMILVILTTSRACKIDDILRKNVKIDNSSFFYSRKSNIFTCASGCLMARLCLSFHLEVDTGLCVLNHRNSTQVTLTPTPGVIFSDISDWSQSLSGSCADHSCHKLRSCLPLRNRKKTCSGVKLADINKDRSKYYSPITGENKPWDLADKTCSSKGGQLLSVRDFGELIFLSRVLVATGPYVNMWTGAVRVEGAWQWADGRAVSDVYWANGQPITTGDCAFMRFGSGLMAGNCSKARRSLCELHRN